MGYLDNASITVDAVLTKKGREILKDGGALNISSFTLSDVGVDYTLWNTSHPSGSAKYGEAIENLPQLEASVHAEYNVRNRLISLGQNSLAIPALQIDSGVDAKNGSVKTFNDGEQSTGTIVLRLVGFDGSNQGVTMIIQKPSVLGLSEGGTLDMGLSGTAMKRNFLSTEGIAQAEAYDLTNTKKVGTDQVTTLVVTPKPQTKKGQTTNIIFVDNETGSQRIMSVTNNVINPISSIIQNPTQ